MPPERAVTSCGQENMVGSILSIGGANRTVSPIFCLKRAGEAMPQITCTTSRYSIVNFAAAATPKARNLFLPSRSLSRTTKHTLPAIMGRTVIRFGAIPSKNAQTGEIRATVMPLRIPTSKTATARTQFTSVPVTNCFVVGSAITEPAACKQISSASSTAVWVIQRIFFCIYILFRMLNDSEKSILHKPPGRNRKVYAPQKRGRDGAIREKDRIKLFFSQRKEKKFLAFSEGVVYLIITRYIGDSLPVLGRLPRLSKHGRAVFSAPVPMNCRTMKYLFSGRGKCT